ncbi:MAG: prepilin peptidase [Candidatus Omnitrophota bacterium]
MSDTFIYISISLFGLIIGSFLNVCIYRLPREKSIVRPSSFCTHCLKPIRWFDNIPVISFVILRGRCRECGKRISFQYPAVETITALIFCLNFHFFGLTPAFLIWNVFACSLLVASVIDFHFQLIPDLISLSGIIVGLALRFFVPQFLSIASEKPFLDSLLGVLAGGGSIYLLGLIGTFAFRKESMGFGDVKLMAMIGAFLGWKLVLLCFFIAPVFGSVWGIFLKIKYKQDIMPYGPFLSLASLVCLYLGKDMLDFFLFGLL